MALPVLVARRFLLFLITQVTEFIIVGHGLAGAVLAHQVPGVRAKWAHCTPGVRVLRTRAARYGGALRGVRPPCPLDWRP